MRSSLAHSIAIGFCISFTLLQGILGTEVRGVNPQKKSFYNSGRDFTCLDGSATIPFALVNDDYCDCRDGSDEPGTAACSNGHFYCQNAGHKSMEILSSRVNDGICDCCDGADEYESSMNCQNNCIELGKKAAEEQERLKELHKEGYQKRLDRSAQSRQKVEDSRIQISEKEAELETVKAELETLQVAKEAAEEPEREAKERHREAWEKEKELRKRERRMSEARGGFEELDTNSDGFVSVDEIQARNELDDDGDGTVSETEALEYLDNQQQINFDTFLDTLWDLISDKCQFQKSVKDMPVLPTPPPPENESEDDEDYDYDDEEEDEDEGGSDEDQMPEYDEETKVLIAAADEARDTYQVTERRKSDLELDISKLKKYIAMDFGRDYEFANLYENCYEYTDLEYTYKMCAFNKVSQKPKNGGRETSLGVWGSWSGSGNIYSQMKYDNGEKCWNGPSRSAIITLKCGLEDELLSASEPNRCEYAMDFFTPAVCEQIKTTGTHTEL